MAKLARGAWPWLLVPLGLGVLLWATTLVTGWWAYAVVGTLALLVFLFFLNFFRDPEAAVGPDIVSPAYGKVVFIDTVEDPDVGRADRLAVFMSPLDIHVNRFPMDGQVLSVRHVAGGFLPAFDKDSERNERVETLLSTTLGTVKVVQIAGAVARRIVPYIHGGETAVKGERFGLIRLGSRCDLIVPFGSVQWTVTVDDKVKAGATTIATPIAGAPAAKAAKGANAAKRRRATAAEDA